MVEADERLKIIVVTGALGSGKTTILNQILKMPVFAKSAVLVNEFGEIAVDHFLIDEIEEDIIVLPSGCICCTIKGDLRDCVIQLLENRMSGAISFSDYIFIETTGLADPLPVIQLFAGDEVLSRNCRVFSVLTTVDAANRDVLPELRSVYERQIALADVIYFSKTDIADGASQRKLMRTVERLNAQAKRIEDKRGLDAQARHWQSGRDWGTGSGAEHFAAGQGEQPVAHEAEGIDSFVIELEGEIDRAGFELWVRALVYAHGRSILRLKGIANIDGRSMVVQSVGPIFHALEPINLAGKEAMDTRLVCIATGLSKQALHTSLAQVRSQKKPALNKPRRTVKPSMPQALADSVDISVVTENALPDRLIAHLRKTLHHALAGGDLNPVLYSGAHNPWSISAAHVDSWSLLEFCEAPDVTALVRTRLGDDFILFDSDMLAPDMIPLRISDNQLHCDDPQILPVEPVTGVVVRVHFGSDLVCHPASGPGEEPLPPVILRDGDVVCHPLSHGWACELSKENWFGYSVRYMSAHSRFIRDMSHPANRTRLQVKPLSNLASLPIWLTSGEDRAGNNFATGFQQPRAEWLAADSTT
jgi:G3E family GTPase